MEELEQRRLGSDPTGNRNSENQSRLRRMLVSAWNPSVLPDTKSSFAENVANQKAALPPCHAFFQFYVAKQQTFLSTCINEVQMFF